MAFLNERIYKSNVPIQYVFEKGTENKNFLIVSFSGFNSLDLPLQKTYNYIRTLSAINTNKLFILDSYGPRGCYYLGGKFDDNKVESSVQSLITYIARRYNIKQKNIICIGSSKGGSAALYYGVKYNYGHIISGAPQTRIADYITEVCPATTEYMLGKNYTQEMKERLNQRIFELFDESVSTDLNIFTSENDWQYKKHVLPLETIMKEKNVKYNICIENKMKSHGEIANYFPDYLTDSVKKIISNNNTSSQTIKTQKISSDTTNVATIKKKVANVISALKTRMPK